MADIHYQHSLRDLNTFGLPVRAAELIFARRLEDVREALRPSGLPLLVLGGGSNMLFTDDLPYRVLLVALPGIAIVEEGARPLISVGAGESWHDLVIWTLDRGMGGLENLALIPGRVGAAPIQNIGAYGLEQDQVFERLQAVDRNTGAVVSLDREACRFGYRDSRFKGAWRDRFIITRVFYRLHRDPYRVQTGYGTLAAELRARSIRRPTVREVAAAVIRVRRSKLPDPHFLGNAGSFFKNPIVPKAQAEELLGRFPGLPTYPVSEKEVKVPAGWLIESCGWKGRRIGDAGCYEKQALVLVNHGQASGKDVLRLARRIQADVRKQFGIGLQPEVNVY